MLAQLSQALQPQQELQMLQLQEREMELLRNNYNALLTASTLVLGFAYGGCIDFTMPGGDPLPEGEPAVGMRPEVLITFYVCVSLSMVLETYSAVVATAAVVYGPDMAINGAKGTSSSVEVACIITRAIGGMRVAKHHIYGSFAAGLFFLLVATCLGTMDKIGYVERMNVSAGVHKFGASMVACIFGLGIIVIAWAFLGAQRVFSTERLLEGRIDNPDVPCVVCGDTVRDGMTSSDRRFLRPPCAGHTGGGFKCYQCIGLRGDFTKYRAPAAPHSGSGGCCSADAPKQPPRLQRQPTGSGAWFNENAPYGAGSQHGDWDMVAEGDATLPSRPGRRPVPLQRGAAPDFGVAQHFHPGPSSSMRPR
eukprot:TRINITY_DN848_c0_g4_i1.p2 TRINITY_DN848_c0_g4~~TRINITY_DN848_c0_g4_i1.p2  ORF type:complete len:394 (+),score=140.71 TRINITY_DN848_c0_g4_i1:91-1182(+)